jgi:hypothetical protein
MRGWKELAEGTAFTDADVRDGSKVCLVGDTLKRELFRGDPAVGKELRIQSVTFKVVGVLSHKGTNIVGVDQDDIVVAPWTASKAMGRQDALAAPPGVAHVDQILAQATSSEQLPQAIDEIRHVLHQRHGIQSGQSDDFQIRDAAELTHRVPPPISAATLNLQAARADMPRPAITDDSWRAWWNIEFAPQQPAGPLQSSRAAEMRAILLAALEYATEHSDWPKTLDELKPKYLDAAKIDLGRFVYHPLSPESLEKNPQEVAVLTEKGPASAGGQLIGFADGYVEFIPTQK